MASSGHSAMARGATGRFMSNHLGGGLQGPTHDSFALVVRLPSLRGPAQVPGDPRGNNSSACGPGPCAHCEPLVRTRCRDGTPFDVKGEVER